MPFFVCIPSLIDVCKFSLINFVLFLTPILLRFHFFLMLRDELVEVLNRDSRLVLSPIYEILLLRHSSLSHI